MSICQIVVAISIAAIVIIAAIFILGVLAIISGIDEDTHDEF